MSVDQGPGVEVLEDPLTNKGTAFTEQERSELGLRGLAAAGTSAASARPRRDITARIGRRQVRGGLIREYRRAA